MNAKKKITRSINGTILVRVGEVEIEHSGQEGMVYAPKHLATKIQEAYDGLPDEGSSAVTVGGRTMSYSAYLETMGAVIVAS